MNRNIILGFLAVLFLIPITACNKKKQKAGRKIEGTWDITSYVRSEIYQDGTEKITKEDVNVGDFTFYLTEKDRELDYILYYRFNYNASNPRQTDTGTIFISDEASRMNFIHFWCNRPIGCDMMYNIKNLTKRRMVLEQYLPVEFKADPPELNKKNLVPGGSPDSEATVFKLRMVLEKK